MLYCYSFWFSKGFLHFFILDFSPFYSIYLALLYTLASMRDWTTFCLVRSCSHAFPSRVCSVSGLGFYGNLQSSHLNLHTQQLHSSYSFQVIPWRARATLESGRALTATFLTFLSWWNWMFDFGAIIIILWSDGFLFLSLSCLSDGRVVGGWKRVAMFMIKFLEWMSLELPQNKFAWGNRLSLVHCLYLFYYNILLWSAVGCA